MGALLQCGFCRNGNDRAISGGDLAHASHAIIPQRYRALIEILDEGLGTPLSDVLLHHVLGAGCAGKRSIQEAGYDSDT